MDYEPAGLGNRLLASILDGLFKAAYVVTAFFVAIAVMEKRTSSTTETVVVILLMLPLLFYDFLFETFMQGQTPGKKIIKLKVVMLDGTQPSVSAYLLRWLIRLFEIDIDYGLIAIISIAASKNSQRLGDMAAGTTVIRIKPHTKIEDTILQLQQKEDYKIVFPAVSSLTDADVQLMKDVYDFYTKTGNTQTLKKLAEKIKAKTGIVTTMKDGLFIATLLKDYNRLE